ncbi:hypothetical protein T440DRAFT_519346 [Plenodomus tracheiphilus IPT5]|uniref:Uncharacterized protein n=1 Tax=Plenodomus tracheiphilus IPT5 TaxID=1408161 RepID=A0A6A7B432_9PLEO|nr:hypothetical protein T440DRAFT_519346 [Plenodomus tracheiphilus IPT5]
MDDAYAWDIQQGHSIKRTLEARRATPKDQISLGTGQFTTNPTHQLEVNVSICTSGHLGHNIPYDLPVSQQFPGLVHPGRVMPTSSMVLQQQQLDHGLAMEDERHKRRRKEIMERRHLPQGINLPCNLNANTHHSFSAANYDPIYSFTGDQSSSDFQFSLGTSPFMRDSFSRTWFPEDTNASFGLRSYLMLPQSSGVYSLKSPDPPLASGRKMQLQSQQNMLSCFPSTFQSELTHQTDHSPTLFDSYLHQGSINLLSTNSAIYKAGILQYAEAPILVGDSHQFQVVDENALQMTPDLWQYDTPGPYFGPDSAQQNSSARHHASRTQVSPKYSSLKRHHTAVEQFNDRCNKMMQIGKVNACLDSMCFYTDPETRTNKTQREEETT